MDLFTPAIIGLHLVTAHVPHHEYRDFTPGIYVQTEAGLTAGIIPENSIVRPSAYIGWTWNITGPLDITAGAIYGYQRRPVKCMQAWVGTTTMTLGEVCGTSPGSPGALAPFLNPSARLPTFWGITPRLTLIPPWAGANATAISLSIEHHF